MSDYIQGIPLRLNHRPLDQPEYLPYKFVNPTYVRQLAKAIPDETFVPLK